MPFSRYTALRLFLFRCFWYCKIFSCWRKKSKRGITVVRILFSERFMCGVCHKVQLKGNIEMLTINFLVFRWPKFGVHYANLGPIFWFPVGKCKAQIRNEIKKSLASEATIVKIADQKRNWLVPNLAITSTHSEKHNFFSLGVFNWWFCFLQIMLCYVSCKRF